jgi:hypothetical protein
MLNNSLPEALTNTQKVAAIFIENGYQAKVVSDSYFTTGVGGFRGSVYTYPNEIQISIPFGLPNPEASLNAINNFNSKWRLAKVYALEEAIIFVCDFVFDPDCADAVDAVSTIMNIVESRLGIFRLFYQALRAGTDK